MRKATDITENKKEQIVTLGLFIILGGLLRLLPSIQADFPLNDGGLFTTMIKDLVANDFLLPPYTSYNQLDIPYAYPPFAFYITGYLHRLSGILLIDLVRILPGIFSTMTIPAFYFLSRQFLSSSRQQLIATAAFAFIPRSFKWLIMGGGLTRALGFLFSILTLYQAWQLFHKPKLKHILLTALWGSAVVLSHPETTYFTVISVLLFFVLFNIKEGFNKEVWMKTFLVGMLVFTLTSIWWGTILRYHGLSAFSTAIKTQWKISPSIMSLLTFKFTEEVFFDLLAVLGLIGIWWELKKRGFFLPIWFLMIFFLTPRSARTFVVLPFALLISTGLVEVILPQFSNMSKEKRINNENKSLENVFVFYILLISFISSLFLPYVDQAELSVLPKSEREDMKWIKDNTPESSVFISIPSKNTWSDVTAEWFPTLTARKNNLTVQGYEWLPDTNFQQKWQEHESLHQCLEKSSNCLLDYIHKHKQRGVPHYLFINRNQKMDLDQERIFLALKDHPSFKIVFLVKGITIFSVRK